MLVFLADGDIDVGLLFTTYPGLTGLSGLCMLAVGMVASFLTSNLTVGFILGALFNAPLAFAASADLIVPEAQWARPDIGLEYFQPAGGFWPRYRQHVLHCLLHDDDRGAGSI